MSRCCKRTRGVRYLAIFILATLATYAHAQVDEAREALRNGEFERAASLLSVSLEQSPSADVYIYLGIAYANLRDYPRAQATLEQGAGKYPEDPRFHNELAGLYLAKNDIERARAELHESLRIDPDNVYAGDLLGNLDLAEGRVRAGLQAWAKHEGPVIAQILNEERPLDASHWTIGRAVAFETGDALRYGEWRTTEQRLYAFGLFNDVRLEIQPTPVSRRYNANIATSLKRSTQLSRMDLVIQSNNWAFTRFLRLDLWDLRGSGISLNGAVRPTSKRKRGELRILVPLPLPGGLTVETSGLWRSESWNVSRVALDPSNAAFTLKSTGWRIMMRAVPDYRVDVAAGFEFTNRKWNAALPHPLADSRDSGKVLLEASVRLIDRSYQNRVRVQTFAARKSIMGNADYSGGTAELNNRLPTPKLKDSTIEWTLKAGTSRGQLPLDEYFVLGAEMNASNLMRGHAAFRRGYGAAPMGTHFLLANAAVDRQIRDVRQINRAFPFLPPIVVKGEVFVDAGKVFDRARVFRQGELLLDAGAGLKFEAPTHALHLIAGHSLRDKNYFAGVYIERRW